MTISSQVLLQSSLPVGPQGLQGIQGLQGTQGIQGMQGVQGAQGAQGRQGIQGTQGEQGIQGIQGTNANVQGIQGTQGTQGVQGTQGTQGIQGTQGTQGIQGLDGSQGLQGIQGVDGFGIQGIQGIEGSQGLQGLQGLDGTGIQGIQGFQGTQGIQGTAGITADQTLNTTSNVTFASVTTPFLTLSGNFAEKFSNINAATGVVVHDCTNGSLFNHTGIASTFTVNVTNIGLNSGFATNLVLILNQSATAYIPTEIQISGSPRPINWQGGAQPIGNASKKDLVSFSILNSSGVYTVFGQLVSFG